jgi:hypothetical protein
MTLAYVFWHMPDPRADAERYAAAQVQFQRSLARRPPIGFRGSTVCRLGPAPPWLPAPGASHGATAAQAYEDWYLLDDWTAIGVLREAALARGHASRHERAARHVAVGTAGIYRLCDGPSAPATTAASLAIWIAPARGADHSGVGELAADGLVGDATLWRRELSLGPAPEYCVLTDEPPAGVASGRLPAGWRTITCPREGIWPG